MRKLEKPIFSKAPGDASIILISIKLGNSYPVQLAPIFISLRASKEMLGNQSLEMYTGVIWGICHR